MRQISYPWPWYCLFEKGGIAEAIHGDDIGGRRLPGDHEIGHRIPVIVCPNGDAKLHVVCALIAGRGGQFLEMYLWIKSTARNAAN